MSIISALEKDASTVLDWIVGAEKKLPTGGPKAIAALGVLLGSVAASIESTGAAASEGGLNIALDAAAAENIKASWTDLVALAAELGIKLP